MTDWPSGAEVSGVVLNFLYIYLYFTRESGRALLQLPSAVLTLSGRDCKCFYNHPKSKLGLRASE